jgi:hypothetical protein
MARLSQKDPRRSRIPSDHSAATCSCSPVHTRAAKGFRGTPLATTTRREFRSGSQKEAVLLRIKADKPVLQAIQERMHPGMVLITTELPAHPNTRTGDDFVLMNSEAS